MIFTREQFDSLGKFYIDDFPIDDSQDVMFKLFNCLPSQIQALAISWGLNDTEFQDKAFDYACNKLLGLTCEEFYESSVVKEYLANGTVIEFDFNQLPT